jgi:hypothetical protein
MLNNKEQRGLSNHPRRFWIIGAGRFGRIAVKRINRSMPVADITVVDQKPSTIEGSYITRVNAEGIAWLVAGLDQRSAVDMIVPAIPVHVAAQWLVRKLAKNYDVHPMQIPNVWLKRMPHACRGKTGQAFVSYADFICPDNCPEPKKICTYTAKPRPMDLFRLLGGLDFDDVLPIVLRSHQLLPGVGGIYPADLLKMLDTAIENDERPLMVATACRCHGVVNFLRLEMKSGKP